MSSIGIIGNMNNNGFALLRYFCDCGYDAYLYPYSSDDQGGLSHFDIEADTWNAADWRHRIRRLPFPNSSRVLYPRLLGTEAPRSTVLVREIAEAHTITVGSGIAPALFAQTGCQLSAFFPYTLGVELVGQLSFVAAMNGSLLKRPFYRFVRSLQIRGILDARCCFNAEMGLTKRVLDEIGRPFERLAVPMVYNGPDNTRTAPSPSKKILELASILGQHEFVVFCHSRQLWVPDPNLSVKQFEVYSKHSDWLIHGFSQFKKNRSVDAVLCLLDYGPDVDASKALIASLGLESSVIWLPRMMRKELMFLLQQADVGVGEFHIEPGTIWGGTGWEVLASGKPLLQAFNFTEERFTAEFGHAPPPILHADSAAAIARHLVRMYDLPATRLQIGAASLAWFNRHNGVALAEKWLKHLTV